MSSQSFTSRVESILNDKGDSGKIEEGTVINVTAIIADAIRIPSGNYIVAAVNADRCVLVPANEAGGQVFEVFRPTLSGFFNPEIHKRTVSAQPGPVLIEEVRTPPIISPRTAAFRDAKYYRGNTKNIVSAHFLRIAAWDRRGQLTDDVTNPGNGVVIIVALTHTNGTKTTIAADGERYWPTDQSYQVELPGADSAIIKAAIKQAIGRFLGEVAT